MGFKVPGIRVIKIQGDRVCLDNRHKTLLLSAYRQLNLKTASTIIKMNRDN